MKLCSSPHKEYRASDNEWYEFLPSTWNERRVKNIFKLITDIAPNDNDFELLSLYTSIGVKPRKDMEQRGNKAVTTDGYWIVKKGDIIVNKLLAWMGAIGLSEYDGVTSPAYDILRKSNQNVDARFYTYLFRTEKAQAIFKKHSRGIMDVRLRLYFDKFGAISVPLPPISEQQAIAHYLDTKTAQVDRKIDLLTQKATSYGNLKQSLINKTVTRGLDKSVPMKDSGIEWLGEVPKHWKINFLVKASSSVVDYRGRTPKKVEAEENGIFLVTARNIKKGYIDYSLSEEFVDIDDVQSLLDRGKPKIGDVLFTTEAPLGEVANVDREDFALAQRIIKFRGQNKTLDNYFMKYWLMSSGFQYSLYCNATGSTALGLKGSKVRLLNIVLPPLSEQKEIADYLDTKTAQIDKIIQTINTQIEKLKEFRKTLINDIVTGKIKVV